MTWTLRQQLFTLAWISYNGDLLRCEPRVQSMRLLKLMQEKLHTADSTRGAWNVVWGPVHHQGPVFDDAMMYVVQHHTNPNQIVVAIRGTNPLSVVTWIGTNFDVGKVVAWPTPPPDPKHPHIARGIWEAFRRILHMVPDPDIPGEGQAIVDFITRYVRTHPATQITVTGHSLGGVLASTFALHLVNTKKAWDPHDKAKVDVWSFAAPTAGDAHFAKHTNEKLGGALHRVWNTHDIVPCAYDFGLLGALRESYSSFWNILLGNVDGAGFIVLEEAARFLAGSHDYVHPQTGNEPFTRRFAPAMLLGEQLIYQHGQAYIDELDLGSVIQVEDVAALYACVEDP